MRFSLSLLFSLVAVGAAFAPTSQNGVATFSLKMGYVPDGMTPAQWKAQQAKENAAKSKKKFAAFGPQSFKSRSLQSFQQDLEKGKAGHLMPVMNAKKLVKQGKLKEEDIPYMQRMGSWDNSDVKNAKKKQWNDADKKYNNVQKAAGIDWSGKKNNFGGPQKRAAAAKQKQEPPKPQTKKLFGLF